MAVGAATRLQRYAQHCGQVLVAGCLMLAKTRAVEQSSLQGRFPHARQMVRMESFDFYPPRTAAHFRDYFYTDAIPPSVQFGYFWLYACLGDPAGTASVVLVGAQALCIGFLVSAGAQGLARGQRRAGLYAVALAASSPLLFWAVVMGQETGMTTVSLAGCFCVMLCSEERGTWKTAVAAGAMAGLGALSREYGCVFVACGLGVAAARRWPWARLLCFAATGVALAAPWYFRTWILTGNPYFSNDVAGIFPLNEVHSGIMRAYRETLSGPAPFIQRCLVESQKGCRAVCRSQAGSARQA